MRIAGFSVVLFLLLSLYGLVQPAPARGEKRPDTFSVDVDLVVLSVTVLNNKGNPVSGLQKENFQVYEDGRAQEIKLFHQEDVPVTIGLVLDNSGSMGTKRSEVVRAGLAFARASNPQDEMFIVNFNERVSLGLPAGTPFTSDFEQLKAALTGVIARGQTALYDAIALALEHEKKGHWDKKVLVVLSDGGDNASRHAYREVLEMARQSNVSIYTIGLFDKRYSKDQNPKVVKQLAKDTGGEVFLPNTPDQLTSVWQRIARDIRSQYTIGYRPTNSKHDGTYRAIRVAITAPKLGKLFVHTRAGYVAPSQTSAAPQAQSTEAP
jgi:VWFA-related protein